MSLDIIPSIIVCRDFLRPFTTDYVAMVSKIIAATALQVHVA